MKTAFVLCLFVAVAYAGYGYQQPAALPAAPAPVLPSYSKSLPLPESSQIPIVRLVQNIKENGADSDFETGNGIKAQEDTAVLEGAEHTEVGDNGELIKTRKEIKKTGSYSYTAPSGEVISMSYVSDGSGFHPVGSHIPTSPPMPEALIKAYAEAAARPAYHEEEEQKYYSAPAPVRAEPSSYYQPAPAAPAPLPVRHYEAPVALPAPKPEIRFNYAPAPSKY